MNKSEFIYTMLKRYGNYTKKDIDNLVSNNNKNTISKLSKEQIKYGVKPNLYSEESDKRRANKIYLSIKNSIDIKVNTFLDFGGASCDISYFLGNSLNANEIYCIDNDSWLDIKFDRRTDVKFLNNLKTIKDNSIDLLLTSHTLHHINDNDLKEIITDFYRILSPHGILVLQEHNCINKEFGKLLDLQHNIYDTVISQISTYDGFIKKFYSNYKSTEEWNSFLNFFKLININHSKSYDNSYIAIYKKKCKIIDDNYELYYSDITYDINRISPELEIARYIGYNNIKNKIIKKCNDYKLIPYKKSMDYMVNSILTREIFSYFSDKHEKYVDGFFPYINDIAGYNKKMYGIFTDSFKYNANINNIVKNINLANEFKNEINIIKKYKIKNTELFDVTHKDNIVLFKNKIEKLNLNFTIPKSVYLKLENDYLKYKKYNNHTYSLDYLVYCLLLRYNTLNSLGHQWAMPIIIKDELKKTFNVNFECFASSLNHYYDYYCSMFYDIEKYFMSLGYFQYIVYVRGFYLANPPYDNNLLNTMVNTFELSLDKADQKSIPLTFMFGLPNWTKFPDYILPEQIRNNKHFLFQKIFEDAQVLWYDFLNNSFERIPSSIRSVITNDKTIKKEIVSKIIDKWIEFSK